MGAIGNPKSFYKKFKFHVEIDGIGSAFFQRCSELVGEFAEVNYSEGGAIIADKTPGRLTFPNLTLERGATDDLDLLNWFREVGIASANAGLPDIVYKRNGDIVQLNRDNTTRRRWSWFDGWPRRFVAGSWDNEVDENVIESVEIVINFFETAAA